MNDYKNIVLLCGDWDTSAIIYDFIETHIGTVMAVQEKPIDRKTFLQKRIKKLGLITVCGQVLFQVAIARWQRKLAQKKIEAKLHHAGLRFTTIPPHKLTHIDSVNSDACIKALTELNPSLIILHGTRILSRSIIDQLSVPIINIHAGITPMYRGVHGGYWALAMNDKNYCGVTVHYVNAGIDTGEVIFQETIMPSANDNFSTYPYLQLITGLQGLKDFLQKGQKKKLAPENSKSKLWYHPTIWNYLYYRIFKGVK